MRTLILVVVAALVFSGTAQAGGVVWANGDNRDNSNQYRVFKDRSDESSVSIIAPLVFEDDFLGAYFQKYVANENTTALWKTVETNLNTGIALSADEVGGAVLITADSDSNAERGVIYFGDNECLDMYQGCGMEVRAQVSTALTTNVELIIGLAGADNSTADSVDAHAWFRLLAAANTALLWETDDGTTDDDDNAAATIAASTWYVLRIEVWGDYAYFYVNGAKVGKGSLAALTSTTGKCQPYIALQKASGVGVGAVKVDYIKCWGER